MWVNVLKEKTDAAQIIFFFFINITENKYLYLIIIMPTLKKKNITILGKHIAKKLEKYLQRLNRFLWNAKTS